MSLFSCILPYEVDCANFRSLTENPFIYEASSAEPSFSKETFVLSAAVAKASSRYLIVSCLSFKNYNVWNWAFLQVFDMFLKILLEAYPCS